MRKKEKKGKRGNLEILPQGVQRLTPPRDLATKTQTIMVSKIVAGGPPAGVNRNNP